MERDQRKPCEDQCHRIGELEDSEVLSNLRVGFRPVRCPAPGMAHEQRENRKEKKRDESNAWMPGNEPLGQPPLDAALGQKGSQRLHTAPLRTSLPDRRRA